MAKATTKTKAAPKRIKKPPTAKAIFTKARKILDDPAHWGKSRYVVASGQYCLMGACYRAAGISEKAMHDSIKIPAIDDLVEPPLGECLQKLFPKRSGYVVHFNDDRRTTHKQILRVLDCAIACAK